MAKPILVANWKNHPSSLFEAKNLLKQLSRSAKVYKKWDFYIAPPLTYFEVVAERAKNFAKLASQDIEILDILKSFGVKLSIIGHSDSRAKGETDEEINKKIKLALKANITSLVCIGENIWDQDGEHFEFLRSQLRSAFLGIKNPRAMVAYEPVWAIGKGSKDAIQSGDLEQTVIFIKKVLSDIFGRKIADKIPVLYGGAVEPSNAESLLKGTGIRGFLVGHASLDAKKLRSIAEVI